MEYINNISNVTKGALRAFPFYVPLTSIIYGILLRNNIGIFFGVYCYLCDILSHELKVFFKYLYGKNVTLPLLGLGRRPNGAKYCGIFIDEENLSGKTSSFGMPSGHSQMAIIAATFWSLYILQQNKKDERTYLSLLIIYSFCVAVLVSRYVLGCHTFQQIFVGGLNGLILGYIGYKIYNRYFS